MPPQMTGTRGVVCTSSTAGIGAKRQRLKPGPWFQLAMSDYQQGSLKYDPETGAVAVRTNQPEDSGNPLIPSQAWLVATPTAGALFVGSSAVAGWTDLEAP